MLTDQSELLLFAEMELLVEGERERLELSIKAPEKIKQRRNVSAERHVLVEAAARNEFSYHFIRFSRFVLP